MTQDYRVLLYYQYVTIENGEQFAKEHLAACKNLGIKGRILVADEGINGTVSGSFEQTEAYINMMHADPRFTETILKLMHLKTMLLKKCTFVTVKNWSALI